MKNLIHDDITRCNDFTCPKNGTCSRFLQRLIDKETRTPYISKTDFKGGKNDGDCIYYIYAE